MTIHTNLGFLLVLICFLHDSSGYKYWTSRNRNVGFTGSNVRAPVVHKPNTSPARHAFSYKSSAASSTSSEHRPLSYNQQPRFVPSGRKAFKMAQSGTRRLVTSIKRPLLPVTKSRRPNRAIPAAVAAPSPCSSFSQCKCCRWTMSYKKTTKMCTKPKYVVKSVKFCVRKRNGMCLRTVNQKQRVPDGVETKPCVTSSGKRECTACCPKIQLGYPCSLAKKQPRSSRHIVPHDKNIQSEQRLGEVREESQLEIKRRNQRLQDEEEERRKAEEELRREQERQGSRFPSGDGILDLRPDDELDEDATEVDTRLTPPVVVEPPANGTGVNRGPQIDLPRRADIPPNPDEEEIDSDDPSELCCGFEGDGRKSCCMNKPAGLYQRCCPRDPFADNDRGDPGMSTPQQNVRRLPTFQRSPEKGPPLCCSDSRQERYQCCLRLQPGSPRNCCSQEHMELLRQDNRVSEFRAPPPQIRQRPDGEKGDPVCCSSNRQERYDCCMKLPANANIQYSCCAPDHLAKIEQDIREREVLEMLPPVRPTPFPRYQELRAPETVRYFPVPQRNTEKGDPVCCSQDRRERYECCLKLPPSVPYSCCSADQMEMLEQDMIKLERPPVPSLPDRGFQELRAPAVSYVPVPQRNTEKGDPVCCSQNRRERYECCKKLPPTVPYSCCSASQMELIERDLDRSVPIRIPPPTPYDPGFQELRAPATSLVLPVPRHTEKGDPLCCTSTRRNRYDCCLKLPLNAPRHCCSAAHMERLKADLDMMERHPDISIRRPPPEPARLVSTGQNSISQSTVDRQHRRCCSKTRRQKKKCCFAYPIGLKPACCEGVDVPETATPSSFYPFTSMPAFDFPNDQGYNSKGDTAWKRNPGPFSGTKRHRKFPPASSAALITSSHSDCCASSARVRDSCCSSTQLMGLQARCCPKLKKPLVSAKPSCCNLAPFVKVDCCADSKWTGQCCPVLG